MTLLQEVRKSRGWTAPQLADKLYVAARQLDITIANVGSLRVMISRWENGRSRPDGRALRLLEHVFKLPSEALGFPEVVDTSISVSPAPGSGSMPATRRGSFSAENFKYFTDQLALHVRADNASGALWVADVATLQLRQLEQHSRTGSQEVNLLAARYAEFLGWLLHDSGEAQQGLKWTERAIDFAEVAGDIALAIYTLMRKSNILIYLAQPQLALAVARKATSRASVDAPHLLPVCLRQVALSHAYCRDESGFRRAFEFAISLTKPTVDGTNSLSSYCTTSYLEMEAALCWLALRKPKNATIACERALDNWPSELVRDQGLCHARQAIAYAELNELDAACNAAHLAIEQVQSAPSARTLHMLRLTSVRLEPFRRNTTVKNLNEALASVA